MKIILATGDMDWQGLYVNGKLAAQGHNIQLHELADAIIERLPRLDISYEEKSVDYDWMEDRGDLPDNIEEVEFGNA